MKYVTLANSIWDVGNIETGTIFRDFIVTQFLQIIPLAHALLSETNENYVRGIVQKGPLHLCAYVGVLKNHKYFDLDYDSIEDLDVHCGLTFAGPGDDTYRPCKDLWYLGWDYGHAGDYTFFPVGMERLITSHLHDGDTKHTIGEVHDQCLSVAKQLVGMYDDKPKKQSNRRLIRMEEK